MLHAETASELELGFGMAKKLERTFGQALGAQAGVLLARLELGHRKLNTDGSCATGHWGQMRDRLGKHPFDFEHYYPRNPCFRLQLWRAVDHDRPFVRASDLCHYGYGEIGCARSDAGVGDPRRNLETVLSRALVELDVAEDLAIVQRLDSDPVTRIKLPRVEARHG